MGFAIPQAEKWPKLAHQKAGQAGQQVRGEAAFPRFRRTPPKLTL